MGEMGNHLRGASSGIIGLMLHPTSAVVTQKSLRVSLSTNCVIRFYTEISFTKAVIQLFSVCQYIPGMQVSCDITLQITHND